VIRAFALLLLLVFAASAATVRLYLKDGSYQTTNEYKILEDRIRYYSTERGEWEEIPLELVDLDRTKKEVAETDASLKADAKAQAEEDAAEVAERREVEKIPVENGVYYIRPSKLEPMKAAESKVVNNKRRSVLKVLSPIPLVPGKATVELDGEAAMMHVAETRPEFYFRLSAEERFGLVKMFPKKGVRIVENLQIMPVTNEIIEEQQQIPTFRKQVADLLFKMWPEKDLEPGEYALVQYTDGKVNLQVWDFSVGSSSGNPPKKGK